MLSLALAVTSLMDRVAAGSGATGGGGAYISGGPDIAKFERCLQAQEAAVNG